MNKRTLSLLLALVLVIGMIPAHAGAAELDNGLQYQVYDDHVEITKYTGDEPVVVIPAQIEGLPVTAIGRGAFMVHQTLTTVELPDTITSIGDDAFCLCEELISIDIPDSVTYIGHDAFYHCESMTGIHVGENNPNYSSDCGVLYDKNKTTLIQAPCAISGSYTIPDGVTTICDYAFRYCRKLSGIEFPDSLTHIGMDAFESCVITSAEFPDGLTYIGNSAFRYCRKLTSITIPDSITHIGNEAFMSCIELTSVTIPDSVTHIGQAAFANCPKVTGFLVDENNPKYASDDRGVMFSKNKTQLIQASAGITGSYTIPDSVTYINDYAFYGCDSLNSLEIPNSVTSIGKHAFGFCERLTTLDLPDGITVIDDFALYGCRRLSDIEIPEGVIHIGHQAFAECGSIDELVIPASVTSIDTYAFRACFGADLGVSTIRFEGDAPTIGEYAFQNAYAIIYYPDDNPTWTEDVMQSYDGSYITWEPYTPPVHEYAAVVTAPTCTARGYTTYTCDCGKHYRYDYVPALGHDFADGICIRCGTENKTPFTDVPADSWFETPVLWAVENGITSGTSDTTFSPGSQCLRAHVVTFLWNAEKKPEPFSSSSDFADVVGGWYEIPVIWAVEQGITSGVSKNWFGANQVCTRYQVVFFLWKAAGSPKPRTTVNPFTDVSPDHFFYNAVLWAVEQGITSGTSDTTFSPTAPCNRAQVVTFLFAAYN